MRTISSTLVLGLMLAACGGEEAKPPVTPTTGASATPPPPVDTTPAPTATATTPAPAKASLMDLQKQSMQTIAESMNAGDSKKFAGAYAEDAVVLVAGMPELKGREAIAKDAQMFFDGFPTRKFAWNRVWVKGDVVVTEWAWTGTNAGEFMGAKATNKPAGALGVSIVWYNADGAVKAEHRYSDFGTVMAQLGLSKEKARPVPTLADKPEVIVAAGKPEEDKNVEAVKAVYAALEGNKEADFLAVMGDGSEYENMARADAPTKGKDGAKKGFKNWTTAFPDQKYSVSNAWGIGDFAIVEYRKSTNWNPLGPGCFGPRGPFPLNGGGRKEFPEPDSKAGGSRCGPRRPAAAGRLH